MDRSIQTRQVLKRGKELEYPTDRYGVGSLLTLSNGINSSRAIMYNHHVEHSVNIIDAEPPLVATGFEAVIGEKSDCYVKSDSNYEIVKVFRRNDYNAIVIGFDRERNFYTAWHQKPFEEFSEGFAVKLNTVFDKKEVGDVIEKDEVIQKTTSFDKYGNYSIGRNLNTAYTISLMAMEDGIGLMNGAEKMMDTYRVHSVNVALNDNDVLLNLFGDKTHYRGMPEVGDKSVDGMVCAVRAIDPMGSIHSLKIKNLSLVEESDTVYYEDGKIVDITIRTNLTPEDIPDTIYFRRIKEMLIEQNRYYIEVYTYMNDIIRNSDDSCSFSEMFSIISEECHDFIDSSAFFVDYDDDPYGNIRIEFKLARRQHLSVGSKLVGRYGNKGTISRIIPPEKSFVCEDGRPIHVIVSALGVCGRLNHKQLDEHAINAYCYSAVCKMKETDDLDEKGQIILDLLKYFNSDEQYEFGKYFKSLSTEKKTILVKRIEKKGIIVVQEPVGNANIFDIAKAEDEFPTPWTRVRFEDGRMSMRKIIVSPMYFLRLKQDPEDKYSVRSRGPTSPVDDLPAKSRRRKMRTEMFSDVPVRMGNQEIESMLTTCIYPQVISRMMAANSTSFDMKLQMAMEYYIEAGEYNPNSPDYEDVYEQFMKDQESIGEILDELDVDPECFDATLDNVCGDFETATSRKSREIIDANLAILGCQLDIKRIHYDHDVILDNISAQYVGDDVIYKDGEIYIRVDDDSDEDE